jgi:regulator of RNase E activity RraA
MISGLAQLAQSLYTAVLADILDSVGQRAQVMRHHIRPLYPEAKLVGRAATMLMHEVDVPPVHPYEMELELLDDLRPGEVMVISTQGCLNSGVWGELLSTHARARGARGAIIDGLTRDSWGITAMQFPVFAVGASPADSKGRCDAVSIRRPVEVGGVVVRNGDLVFADRDGCLAIPQSVEEEVLERAVRKVAQENVVRGILRQGASIRKVFAEHGVL